MSCKMLTSIAMGTRGSRCDKCTHRIPFLWTKSSSQSRWEQTLLASRRNWWRRQGWTVGPCQRVTSFATNNKPLGSWTKLFRCPPAHQGLAVKAMPEQRRILCRPKGSSNTSPTGQGKECQGYNWLWQWAGGPRWFFCVTPLFVTGTVRIDM